MNIVCKMNTPPYGPNGPPRPVPNPPQGLRLRRSLFITAMQREVLETIDLSSVVSSSYWLVRGQDVSLFILDQVYLQEMLSS